MSIYTKYLNFDLLTIPISLSFKKKYLYKTFIGSTLTIFGAILIVVFFIIRLNQIINKSLFTLISNEFQNPKGEIDFSNIPILFALTDNNGNPLKLNSQIFEFSAVLSEYVQNFDINGNINIINTEKEIEIERCDNLTGFVDFSYFSEYNISYFKCIKPNQNLTINGIYGDIMSGYKSLKINIKKCTIENCYNDKYIESYISNTKLVVIYLGYKTNFYNKNNKDIEKTIYSRSISLSPFFSKKVFYSMTLVKYELYDDLLLNNKKENLYFLNRDTFVEFNPNIYINDIKNDTFAFFCFVYDGNMLRYTKKVEKIGEIFSYLGNFFNIMQTFFRIINNYFSNKILFIDIFYTFFFEDRFKKRDKIVHFDNSKLFFLFNNNSNQSKLNIKTQEKSINSNINLNINSFIQQDKNLENNINKNSSLSPKNYNKNGLRRILTNKSKIIEKEKKVFKKDSKLYFFCPLWVIKSKKNLNHLLTIKESICNSFSLENFLEIIKLKNSINNFQRERNQHFNEQQKNNLSDKNVRRQINKILNDK